MSIKEQYNVKGIEEMAILTTLEIQMLGITGKDKDATDIANSSLNTSDQAGYYSKIKIERKDLKDLLKVADEARKYRREVTRPWGSKQRMLSTKQLMEYTDRMNQYKTAFENEVYDVKARWSEILNNQQNRLGPIFNPDEYPDASELSDHFTFTYNVEPIPKGDHLVLDIEEDLLKEFQRKLDEENQTKLNDSMAGMWVKLHKPIAKMADICTNDKRVYDTMVESVTETVRILRQLNVTGDLTLDDMLSKVECQLIGYTSGQIRDDKEFKKSLGETAEKLAKDIEKKVTQPVDATGIQTDSQTLSIGKVNVNDTLHSAADLENAHKTWDDYTDEEQGIFATGAYTPMGGDDEIFTVDNTGNTEEINNANDAGFEMPTALKDLLN